jgi:hypothetical protein
LEIYGEKIISIIIWGWKHPHYISLTKIFNNTTRRIKMKKEKVIIDVFESEDGYEFFRVYLAHQKIGVYTPPSNLNGEGIFIYSEHIDDDYLDEWDIVEDFRCE